VEKNDQERLERALSFADIDECSVVEEPCKMSEDCENTPGNYTCVCSHGYTVDESGLCTGEYLFFWEDSRFQFGFDACLTKRHFLNSAKIHFSANEAIAPPEKHIHDAVTEK